MLIDVESENLQQVAAEIHEEPFEKKLQQNIIYFTLGVSLPTSKDLRMPDFRLLHQGLHRTIPSGNNRDRFR